MKTLWLWIISITYAFIIITLFNNTNKSFLVAYIGGILGLKITMIVSRHLGIDMKEV